jgi:hypothetical protein
MVEPIVSLARGAHTAGPDQGLLVPPFPLSDNASETQLSRIPPSLLSFN